MIHLGEGIAGDFGRSVGYMLYDRLLSSRHRVSDPEQADYFFVPALGNRFNRRYEVMRYISHTWCVRIESSERASERAPRDTLYRRERVWGVQRCCHKLRIERLGFGTARQKMALERETNHKLPRRTCSPRHGLQSCRGKSAGVAKRPRERIFPPLNCHT